MPIELRNTDDGDLRRLAARTAWELQRTLAAHGYAIRVNPAGTEGGYPYVEFAPLRVDLAERIIAGLRGLIA